MALDKLGGTMEEHINAVKRLKEACETLERDFAQSPDPENMHLDDSNVEIVAFAMEWLVRNHYRAN